MILRAILTREFKFVDVFHKEGIKIDISLLIMRPNNALAAVLDLKTLCYMYQLGQKE